MSDIPIKVKLDAIDAKNSSKILLDYFQRMDESLENVSLEIKRLSANIQKEFKKSRDQVEDTNKSFIAMAKNIGATATVIGTAVIAFRKLYTTVTDVIGGLYKAHNSMITIRNSLTLAAGGLDGANKEMQRMADLARKLGLQIVDLGKNYSKFATAATQAGLTIDEAYKIFENFAGAVRVLNLGTQEIEGVFRALFQMFSKGKVYAEELRGQLGEHLPGAVSLAASAMGMSVGELDVALRKGEIIASDLLPKLGEAINSLYGEQIPRAVDTTNAKLNTLNEEWNQLSANAYQAIEPGVNAVLDFAIGTTEGLNELAFGTKDLTEANKTAVEQLVSSSEIMGAKLKDVLSTTEQISSISKTMGYDQLTTLIDEFNQRITIQMAQLAALRQQVNEGKITFEQYANAEIAVIRAAREAGASLEYYRELLKSLKKEQAAATGAVQDFLDPINELIQKYRESAEMAGKSAREREKLAASYEVERLAIQAIDKGELGLAQRYRDSLAEILKLIDAKHNAIDASKKSSKASKKEEENYLSFSQTLDDFISKLEIQTEAVGATKKETALYNLEIERIRLESELWNKIVQDTTTDIGALNDYYIRGTIAIQKYYEAKKQDISVTKDVSKAAEDMQKSLEKIFAAVEDDAIDLFADILTGGVDSFKDLASSVKSIFVDLMKDLIKLSLSNPIQFNALISGSGSLGGTGTGVAGGALGAASTLGTAASSLSTIASVGSSILSAWTATGLATSAAGLSVAGGLIGTGTVSGVLGGIGMGIGIAMPYLLPVLAIAAALGAFSSNKDVTPDLQMFSNLENRPYLQGIEPGTYDYSKNDIGFSLATGFGGPIGGYTQHDYIGSAKEAEDFFNTLQAQLLPEQLLAEMVAPEVADRINAVLAGIPNSFDVEDPEDFEAAIAKFFDIRYSAIFDEIGGTMSYLFDTMVEGGASAVEAATGIVNLFTTIDAYKNVLSSYAEAVEIANRTLLDEYNAQKEVVYDLINAFDGSYDSVTNLTNALYTQMEAALLLLEYIDTVRTSVNDSINDLLEQVRVSQMTDQQVYDYYAKIAEDLANSIPTITDPEILQNTIDDMVDAVNSALAVLTDEQMAVMGPDIEEFLLGALGLSNEQLAAIEEMVKNDAEAITGSVELTLESGAAKLSEAAGEILSAASILADSASNIASGGSDIQFAGGAIASAANSLSRAAGSFSRVASDFGSL